MLTYERYKEIITGTTLSEVDFNALILNFKIEVLSIISDVYKLDDLYASDINLEFIIAGQIQYVELQGEFSDGIVSQSATNSSVTYASDKKEGEYNWNKSVKDYIQNKYGVGVIRVETCI